MSTRVDSGNWNLFLFCRRKIKKTVFLDSFFDFVWNKLLPSGLSLPDHSQNVVGNDVQVADIGVPYIFHFIIIHQVTEEVLLVFGKIKFEIFQCR